MFDKDRANLLAILDAMEQIQNYTDNISNSDQFFDNRLVFDATLMNFVVLGEMATRVSENTQSLNPQIEWSEIRAFRNLVAHEYLGIDAEEVWQTIHNDIPALRRSLQKLLDAHGED